MVNKNTGVIGMTGDMQVLHSKISKSIMAIMESINKSRECKCGWTKETCGSMLNIPASMQQFADGIATIILGASMRNCTAIMEIAYKNAFFSYAMIHKAMCVSNPALEEAAVDAEKHAKIIDHIQDKTMGMTKEQMIEYLNSDDEVLKDVPPVIMQDLIEFIRNLPEENSQQ